MSVKDFKKDADLELKYHEVHGTEPNLGEREPLIEAVGSKVNQSMDNNDIFVDDREVRSEIGKYCAIKSFYRET